MRALRPPSATLVVDGQLLQLASAAAQAKKVRHGLGLVDTHRPIPLRSRSMAMLVHEPALHGADDPVQSMGDELTGTARARGRPAPPAARWLRLPGSAGSGLAGSAAGWLLGWPRPQRRRNRAGGRSAAGACADGSSACSELRQGEGRSAVAAGPFAYHRAGGPAGPRPMRAAALGGQGCACAVTPFPGPDDRAPRRTGRPVRRRAARRGRVAGDRLACGQRRDDGVPGSGHRQLPTPASAAPRRSRRAGHRIGGGPARCAAIQAGRRSAGPGSPAGPPRAAFAGVADVPLHGAPGVTNAAVRRLVPAPHWPSCRAAAAPRPAPCPLPVVTAACAAGERCTSRPHGGPGRGRDGCGRPG